MARPLDYWMMTTGDDPEPGITGGIAGRTEPEDTTAVVSLCSQAFSQMRFRQAIDDLLVSIAFASCVSASYVLSCFRISFASGFLEACGGAIMSSPVHEIALRSHAKPVPGGMNSPVASHGVSDRQSLSSSRSKLPKRD